MCFWKYLSLFCCCICAYYVESCIFIEQIFLGRALTSICHFFCLPVCPSICRAPYLRNCASSNHYFWYTCVKWWYFQGLFFFFFKFHFFILCISGTVPHIIVIFWVFQSLSINVRCSPVSSHVCDFSCILVSLKKRTLYGMQWNFLK